MCEEQDLRTSCMNCEDTYLVARTLSTPCNAFVVHDIFILGELWFVISTNKCQHNQDLKHLPVEWRGRSLYLEVAGRQTTAAQLNKDQTRNVNKHLYTYRNVESLKQSMQYKCYKCNKCFIVNAQQQCIIFSVFTF